jgi:hypothetical protein
MKNLAGYVDAVNGTQGQIKEQLSYIAHSPARRAGLSANPSRKSRRMFSIQI